MTRRRPGSSTPVPPVEAEDYPWALAAAAQEDVPPPDQYPATETIAGAITTPNTAVPLTDGESAKPDWYAPYEALQRDWSKLIERVQQTGEPLFYAKGYADMIPRLQALAENGQIPSETRAPMIEALENHQRDLSARKYVEDYHWQPPNGTWIRMLPSSASPMASAYRSFRYPITWAGDRKPTA